MRVLLITMMFLVLGSAKPSLARTTDAQKDAQILRDAGISQSADPNAAFGPSIGAAAITESATNVAAQITDSDGNLANAECCGKNTAKGSWVKTPVIETAELMPATKPNGRTD